jgi:hypothetical protein
VRRAAHAGQRAVHDAAPSRMSGLQHLTTSALRLALRGLTRSPVQEARTFCVALSVHSLRPPIGFVALLRQIRAHWSLGWRKAANMSRC